MFRILPKSADALYLFSRRWTVGSVRWRSEQLNVSECQKAGPETNCILDQCAIRPGTPQPCVVIIGGGLAGLSAGARLAQCGITNFRILEAMDRAGGRVRTCWLGDTVAEGGWSVIEGASIANPLFTLAATERLLPAPVRRLDEPLLVLTAEGRAVDDRLATKAKDMFAELEMSLAEPLGRSHGFKSLGDRITAAMEARLAELPNYERWDVARAFRGLVGSLKPRLGQSPDQLSPGILSEVWPLPGGNVAVSGGMTSLLAPLLRVLPAGALLTCKPVSTVLWGTAGPAGPRAVVRACDGEEFPADYVIVTLPLGVLKTAADRLFCPQLPAYKIEAVRGLGFGAINKLFLKYDTPFWAEESGEFLFSWSPEDLSEEETWVKGISSMEIVRGSKKVICLSVSGEEAVEVEGLSDSEVVRDVSRLLRRFLGSSLLPHPSEVLRSSWSSSPYFGGFKTYLGRGSGRGMLSGLASPVPTECEEVPPVLLFAGEHTHPEYFGTPHGSRLSGIREADRIATLTKRFNGPPSKTPVCIPCS